jgi:hypothetical protein
MQWNLVATSNGWEMTAPDGNVLDTLTWDRERSEYLNAAGEGVGRTWDDARRACERKALGREGRRR